LNVKLCLFVFFPMAIAWILSGFAFIKFIENQFINFKLSASNVLTTLYMSWSQYDILSHILLQYVNFACPIIANSQCWLFALRANTSNIRICPRISVFAPVFNFRYLRSDLKDYTV
jgi:hypothetical protein